MSSVVELEPSELGFRRPFDHEVSQTLRIYNPQSDPIAFKVKTTAPKQYCVRPNSGRIEPKQHVEVQVLLQAMKEEPPLDTRCRDKFLVQSIAIDASQEHSGIQQVWQNLETEGKAKVEERKIRVNFLPADGSAVNGLSQVDDSYSRGSPTPAPRTPMRGATETASTDPVSRPESRSADSKKVGELLDEGHHHTSGNSTVAAAAEKVSNAIPISAEDLKAQLAEAQATISRLQSQAYDSVLRQRKTDTSDKAPKDSASGGLAVQQVGPTGVPVQIVAGLCLLCFLVAYVFF